MEIIAPNFKSERWSWWCCRTSCPIVTAQSLVPPHSYWPLPPPSVSPPLSPSPLLLLLPPTPSNPSLLIPSPVLPPLPSTPSTSPPLPPLLSTPSTLPSSYHTSYFCYSSSPSFFISSSSFTFSPLYSSYPSSLGLLFLP